MVVMAQGFHHGEMHGPEHGGGFHGHEGHGYGPGFIPFIPIAPIIIEEPQYGPDEASCYYVHGVFQWNGYNWVCVIPNE